MNLIKILTAESQSNIKVYELIDDFFLILTKTNWLKEYIFWELKLLSVLGFNLELKKLVIKKIVKDKVIYIVESPTEKKVVPNFLIDNNNDLDNLNDILDGLKLVGDFMYKTILKPNNINLPIGRNHFIDSLKSFI